MVQVLTQLGARAGWQQVSAWAGGAVLVAGDSMAVHHVRDFGVLHSNQKLGLVALLQSNTAPVCRNAGWL